jgi:RES domain-containing protein
MAEVVVHMDLTNAPDDYQMVTIYVPDDVSVAIINSDNLPPNWNAYPAPAFDQNIGDQFVRDNRFCVLKIPSSVTQGDYNYLINPNHPEFSKIRILGKEKFPFDERIFK